MVDFGSESVKILPAAIVSNINLSLRNFYCNFGH
jgi:hypothetical protein